MPGLIKIPGSVAVQPVEGVDVAGVSTGGGGGGFDPNTITGLLGWWKADSLALSDGAAVATWADSSSNGNNATQATAANRPTYKTAIQNGLPSVRFDTTNDGMATTAARAVSTNLTLFLVYTPTGPASMRIVQGSNNWLVGPYGGQQAKFFAGVFVTEPGTSANPGQVLLHVVTESSAGALAQYVNGAAAGTGTGNAWPGNINFGTSGSVTNEVAYADVFEALVYNTVLSTSDRQSVEAYLKAKWGTP